MWNIAIVVIALELIALSGTVKSQDDGNVSSAPIESAMSASRMAGDYTGIQGLKSIDAKAAAQNTSLRIVDSNDTPFLDDSVVNRTVWEVKAVSEVRSGAGSTRASNQPVPYREFIMLIDSIDGRLFRVCCLYESVDTNLAPEPPADSAAKQLGASGEVYHSFLESPPGITFLEALDIARPCLPERAKEIIAYPVWYSHGNGDLEPVWVILSHGIPTWGSMRDVENSLPQYLKNKQRCMIHAETGELLLIANTPTPLLRPTE